MNKVILLKSDDWEGLYVNGKLVEEGHTLNEGNERVVYFFGLAEKHKFKLGSLESKCLSQKDCEWTEEMGSFPVSVDSFNDVY